MKKTVVKSFGLLLAISAASPNCWALDLKFDGSVNDVFLTSGNWSEITFPGGVPTVTPTAAVPGVGDRANINDNFVVSYATPVSTTVTSLIVGGDAPQLPGDLGTPGRLNMSAGMITVSGGGDSFQIARACCDDLVTDVSVVELTGSAVLTALGSDPIVGTRDAGQLLIRDTASVIANPPVPLGFPGNHWRLGNYGPSFDPGIGGLRGDGLLDVSDNGSFSAHVIFIGDNDSSGEVRVSDNGSVILTGNLVPRPSGFFPMGSAAVRMSGSNATLEAFNLESESLPGEIRTSYRFDADALGVSEIKLTDAINITNNDLAVNLNGLVLGPLGKITLFDGDQALAGNRIFGTFANLTVNGVVNPVNYTVVYDQALGDIQLMRIPEPSTMLLLGLGMVMAISAKRRASR